MNICVSFHWTGWKNRAIMTQIRIIFVFN